MFEVVTSEASYLRSLNVLRDHFLGSRELDDTLVIHDKKALFSNILQVHEVTQRSVPLTTTTIIIIIIIMSLINHYYTQTHRFLQDLLARVDTSLLISDVCDIIYHHAHTHFFVYVEYVRNQMYQEKTYSKLMYQTHTHTHTKCLLSCTVFCIVPFFVLQTFVVCVGSVKACSTQ